MSPNEPIGRGNVRPLLLLGTFVGVLVFLVYSSGVSHPFHYDDLHSIRDNPHLRSVENIPQFFYRTDFFSADPRGRMYRPLVLVSYAFNYGLDKLQVESYHWFNMGVHALNSALVIAVGRLFLSGLWPPLVAGLIFALHPINSEVVSYISSRSESLCALFFLTSFLCYACARRAERWSVPLMGTSLLAFVGALLCKSVAITLVPLLFLCEWRFLSPVLSPRTLVKCLTPFFLLALVYVVGMRQMLHTALLGAPVRDEWTQWATQIKALAYYAKLLVFPWPLNVEHPFTLGSAGTVVGLALLLVISCVVALWRGGPIARVAGAWFLLVLAPTFFVPLNVLVNEHRLYIPSAMFSIGLAALMQRGCGAKRVWALVPLLVLYAGLDLRRTAQWRSPETLWEASLEESYYMPRPHVYMGDALRNAGRNREALGHYKKALEVYPNVLSGGDRLSIYNNMGAVYLAMEAWDESVKSYSNALQIDPDYTLAKAGLEGAKAMRVEGGKATAMKWQKQGLLALVEGRVGEAVGLLDRSARLYPLSQTYSALAQAHGRLGDLKGMRSAYQSIIALDPKSAAAERARDRLRALPEKVD